MLNQKGFTPTLVTLTVVLVIAVFGGIYYLGKMNQSVQFKPVNQTSNLSPFPSSTSTPTPSVSSVSLQPLPTTNWKMMQSTYFSLMHPPTWKEKGKSGGCERELDLDTPLTTWICINTSDQTPQQNVDAQIKAFVDTNEKLTNQKNFSYHNLTGVEFGINNTLLEIDAFVANPTNSQSGSLHLTLSSHNPITDPDKQLFETVLSTVKFTQ